MGSPPPERRPSTASESKKLVAEYQQNLKTAKEQSESARTESERRRRGLRTAILAGVIAVLLYLAFSPPRWLNPAPPPMPTAEERVASDRFAIFLQAQRVEGFKSSRGRLPSTLDEAGEAIPGIRYEVLGDGGYALTSLRDTSVRYTSRDSLPAFLGQSTRLLGGQQ
jgi:hypothetical protein